MQDDDDRRRLRALRLVDGDGVGQAHGVELAHAQAQAAPVVAGQQHAVALGVVVLDDAHLAVHQLALVVVLGLDHAIEDPQRRARDGGAVGVQAARSSALSASMPAGPRCMGETTSTSARGSRS